MRRISVCVVYALSGSIGVLKMSVRKFLVAGVLSAPALVASAQRIDTLRALSRPPSVIDSAIALRNRVRAYTLSNQVTILREFIALLAIPNVASDSSNIRRNAAQLLAMLERRGIASRLLEVPGSPPAVYGAILTPAARSTLTLYAHYDGQPVRAGDWTSPPWNPVVKEGRVYARSASDDKGSIVAILSAIDALRNTHTPLAVNINLFFEGEEEAESPHLGELLKRYRDLLRSDLWIICDGPANPQGNAQLVLGVRGTVGLSIRAYGPSRALHSGHYGNWAPNPVATIASVVASMRAPGGRVLIPGFYDDVRMPSAAEKRAISRLPQPDTLLLRELLLASPERGEGLLAERILLPALNVRGINGGQTGPSAPNAIPMIADASIDFRLVPHQTPEGVMKAVERHLRALGYTIVNHEPTDAERRQTPRLLWLQWEAGYPGMRTSVETPEVQTLIQTLTGATDLPILTVPSSGGSLGLYFFTQILNAPVVLLSFANYDNRQHGSDENIRIDNLWMGIELIAATMAHFGYR